MLNVPTEGIKHIARRDPSNPQLAELHEAIKRTNLGSKVNEKQVIARKGTYGHEEGELHVNFTWVRSGYIITARNQTIP
jgi:hypothetical protein